MTPPHPRECNLDEAIRCGVDQSHVRVRPASSSPPASSTSADLPPQGAEISTFGIKMKRTTSHARHCHLQATGKESTILVLSRAAEPLFDRLSVAFTRPIYERFVLLAVGAILAMGRRTTAAVCWVTRMLLDGHLSDYHRVFSRAVSAGHAGPRGDGGRARAGAQGDACRPQRGRHDGAAQWRPRLQQRVPPRHGPLHPQLHRAEVGPQVGRVVAVNVMLPLARRPWALPVMACL